MIAEVGAGLAAVVEDADSSVYHVAPDGNGIVVKEVLMMNGYAAVEEEKPGVSGLLSQEIADG